MSSSTNLRPCGVHLVGSIPLSSTEEVFGYISRTVGDHVVRIPDGETGERYYFTMSQRAMFPEHIQLWLASPNLPAQMVETVPQKEVEHIVNGLPKIQTGYDNAAIESYATFKALKEQGIIPKNVRFQVCLPTPINVLGLLRPSYRAAIEPLYEAALLRALTRIQAEIPADQLAIQFDLALDMGMIEGLFFMLPWFDGPVLDGVVDRVLRLIAQVKLDVEMGFHLCYGDIAHKHFLEPASTKNMVDVTNAIIQRVGAERTVQWIHMPVPQDRDDMEYLAPLRELKLRQETTLYLGLVHADDHEGTLRRIRTAEQVGLGYAFGVATECGMGRTPAGELDSIFAILEGVSDPIVDHKASTGTNGHA